MDSAPAIFSFLIAALLGFLVGLERERKREARGYIFAGVRTFPSSRSSALSAVSS